MPHYHLGKGKRAVPVLLLATMLILADGSLRQAFRGGQCFSLLPRHLQPQGEVFPLIFGGLGLVTQEEIVGLGFFFLAVGVL